MKKTLVLVLVIMLSLSACSLGGGDEETSKDGSSSTSTSTSKDSSDSAKVALTKCPSKTKIEVLNTSNFQVQDFDYEEAYGSYNKTFGTYRAIFINYDITEDNDFKKMEGDDKKLTIAVFNEDRTELESGIYKIKNGENSKNLLGITIEYEGGSQSAASVNSADIGSVEIFEASDEVLCGTIDITDELGLSVKGQFNVKNISS